jgi:hypothetical protein
MMNTCESSIKQSTKQRNKTKHTTKGEKKVQDGRTQVLANEELFKRWWTARRTWEQIKHLNP